MSKKELLVDIFKWLSIGLLCCFGVSYLISTNETLYNLLFLSLGGYSYIIFLILEVAICLILFLKIADLNPVVAKLLYILYTVLTGTTLTGLLLMYTKSSIAMVFLATAVVFGIFVLVGKYTKVDMSKWGIYLLFALLAVIVFEVINIFLMNNTLNIILCITTIVIFSAYTAYDINKLMHNDYYFDNKGIYYAFQLFLDFINIFIRLLRLFGDRRN